MNPGWNCSRAPWFGLPLPSRTPEAIVRRASTDLHAALACAGIVKT